MDSDKNDPSDHSCDTSLSLGRLTNTFITKKEKSVSSLKFDHVLPCLSLGTVSHHQGSASLGSSSYNNNDDDNDNSGSMKRTTSDQEDDDEEEASPKKKLRLNKGQAVVLEDTFKQHTTLNPIQKDALAKQLNLRPRQVEVWFQNRRARTKMKQIEVECETLKKEWEKLTEDNKRLQEELQHLKSSSGSVYVQIPVSGSLVSVCPSCSHHYPSSSRKAAVFPKTADSTKAPQLFTHSPTAC